MKIAHQNLVLLAAAAALIALLVVDERREQARLARAIAPQPPLTALDVNAIRRIRLGNPGSPDIVLDKTPAGWVLREPVVMPADLVQVGNLTALASREIRGSIDAAAVRRADLGLDPARSTVQFDALRLALGEIEPLKRSRYVEVGDGPAAAIRLVDDPEPAAFDGEYTDLINKALLPHDVEPVAIDTPALHLVRAADGRWHAEPPAAAATAEAVAAVVEAWTTLRAQATLPPLAEAGSDAPAEVRVRLADGRVIGYRLIERAEAHYLQRLDVPVSYQFAPAEAAALLRLPAPAAAAP